MNGDPVTQDQFEWAINALADQLQEDVGVNLQGKCSECRQPIDPKATRCPHCRTKLETYEAVQRRKEAERKQAEAEWFRRQQGPGPITKFAIAYVGGLLLGNAIAGPLCGLSWLFSADPTDNFVGFSTLVGLVTWVVMSIWVFSLGREASFKSSLAFIPVGLVVGLILTAINLFLHAISAWGPPLLHLLTSPAVILVVVGALGLRLLARRGTAQRVPASIPAPELDPEFAPVTGPVGKSASHDQGSRSAGGGVTSAHSPTKPDRTAVPAAPPQPREDGKSKGNPHATKPVQGPQSQFGFNGPTKPDLARLLAREDPRNPFHDLAGYGTAVDTVLKLAATALSRPDHDPSHIRLVVTGAGGLDAAAVASRLARLLALPYVGLNPSMARSSHDLFLSITRACAGSGLKHGDSRVGSLRPEAQDSPSRFVAPPMVVSIDELHRMPVELIRCLVTATDAAKHSFVTDRGDYLDATSICWVISTSEPKRLPRLLLDRFTNPAYPS